MRTRLLTLALLIALGTALSLSPLTSSRAHALSYQSLLSSLSSLFGVEKAKSALARVFASPTTQVAQVGGIHGDVLYVDNKLSEDCANGNYSIVSRSCTGQDGNAYRTIQQAADQAYPGVTVAIREGVYSETGYINPRGPVTVSLNKSGTENSPITFTSYQGERAVLDGANLEEGWTKCPSKQECGDAQGWQNMYYKQISGVPTGDQIALFQGDNILDVSMSPTPLDGHYYDVPKDNWHIIPAAGYSTTSIQDPKVFSQSDSGYWTKSSYVLIHSCNNNVITRKIKSYNPSLNRIEFDSFGGENCMDVGKDDYAIINHADLVNRPGTYYVDEQEERLYLWPVSSEPSDVRVGNRVAAFSLNEQDYIVIKNLEFTGYIGGDVTGAISYWASGENRSSSNVIIEDNYFHHMKNGALRINYADYFVARRNKIHMTQLGRAILFTDGTDSILEENDLRTVGGTGLTFFGMKNSKIINNKNYDSNGEHANGLTMYLGCDNVVAEGNEIVNSNAAVTFQDSTNLTIRNNLIVGSNIQIAGWSGKNVVTQPGNIIIEHNTVYDDKKSAYITVSGDFTNVQIRNNIVSYLVDSDHAHSHNVLLTPQIYDLTLYNEQVITNPSQLFVNHTQGDFRLIGGYIGTPPVNMCSMGTDGTAVGAFPCIGCVDSTPIASFYPNSLEGVADLTVTFDASASQSCGGNPITNYEWDFGDGTRVSGANLTNPIHTYSAGQHNVTLKVTANNGRSDSESVGIRVLPVSEPNTVLFLPFDGHLADLSGLRNDAIPVGGITYGQGKEGEALYLDASASSTYPYVEASLSPELDGMDELHVSLWAKKHDKDIGGILLTKHVTYDLSLGDNDVNGYINGNWVNAPTNSVTQVHNTDWHFYELIYDGTKVVIKVDHVEVASAPATGSVAVNPTRDIFIGKNQWGTTFHGLIDEVKVKNKAPFIDVPTASLTLASGVIEKGQSTTLSWTSTNTTSCTGTNFSTGGAVSGSLTVSPTVTTSYSLTCTGAGGTATTDPLTLEVTAPDLAPPVLTNLSVTNITTTGATLTWTTDELATSQVRYGLTTSYGSQTTETTTVTTSHSVTLTGLSSNTTYHYSVQSRDEHGNAVVSGDATFTTLTPPDTTLPTVSITSPTGGTHKGTITVTATANDNVAVSSVTLLVDGTEQGTDTDPPYSFGLDTTTLSDGSHTLTARAKDTSNNTTTSASVTITVDNTPPPPPDTTKPTISGITATNVSTTTKPQAIRITYTTNEPATGVIRAGTSSTSFIRTYTLPDLLTSQSVVLYNLPRWTTIYYQIEATDAAGNTTVSPTYSVRTAGKVAAIKNLSAQSGSGVILSWELPEDEDVEGIRIIRTKGAKVANTTDTPLVTLSPTATTYKDTGVSNNTDYTYTVYTTADGEYSDPATVTFKQTPKPPTLSNTAKEALKAQATSRGGGGGGSRASKTVTSTKKATTPSSGNNTGRRTTTATPLRSLPLLSAGTRTTLPKDTTLTILKGPVSLKSGSWYQVRTQSGTTGWVSAGTVGTASAPSTSTVTPTKAPSITTNPLTTWLTYGMTSPQVATLQKLLNAKGYPVATTGDGSPGRETTYFGRATEAALKRYQCAALNICSGTPATTGYGATGPRTRQGLGG